MDAKYFALTCNTKKSLGSTMAFLRRKGGVVPTLKRI